MCGVHRYIFLEELWARRKSTKPNSSVDFAIHEREMDSEGYTGHPCDSPAQQEVHMKLRAPAMVAADQSPPNASEMTISSV